MFVNRLKKVSKCILEENASFVGEGRREAGKFETRELLKEVVRDYTIHLGREIKWVKNDNVRCRAKCKEQYCDIWEFL